MKNLIFRYYFIILSLILFSYSAAFSQVVNSYGIKGGAVFAKQNYDYSEPITMDTKYRLGADAAVFGEFFKHPNFSGIVEFHYIQKGYKLSVPITTIEQPDGTGQYITLNPRIDYISLPLFVKIRKDYASVSPYIFAGPRFDLKIAYSTEYGYSNYNDLNSVDFGLTGGAGLDFHISKNIGLLLEGRYSYPVTSSFSSSFVTIKNYSFEILGGIEFDILKK